MRIYHNPALFGLTKDLREPDHRNGPRGNEIVEYGTRSNGGELIGIPEEEEACLRREDLKPVQAALSGVITELEN